METTISFSLREVYGVVKAYPANPQAERLADLVGTKTLTLSTLKQAAKMGFALQYVDRFGSREVWTTEAIALRLTA